MDSDARLLRSAFEIASVSFLSRILRLQRFAFAAAALLFSQACARNLVPLQPWIDATIRVRSSRGTDGTGFLIEKNSGVTRKTYLVFNKHLIDADPTIRHAADSMTLMMNALRSADEIATATYKLDLKPSGNSIWREHPEPEVDVMATDLTEFLKLHKEVVNRPVSISLFVEPHSPASGRIQVGDVAYFVGYPLDFTYTETNTPFVRHGVIASSLDHPVKIDSRFPSGKVDRFSLRGFLLDAFILPGSSGSPVVVIPPRGLKDVAGSDVPRGTPLLIGIVSRTTLTTIHLATGETPVLAGLGIIFDAKTIRETIDLF